MNHIQQTASGLGPSVSRRRVAAGLVWATPTITAVTAIPAFAASRGDISIVKGDCYDPWIGNNTMRYQVCITNTSLAIGSVFRWQYSGANSRPTWSGTLANNSTVTPNYQGSYIFAGGWGDITFTTTSALTQGSCWTVTFSYDIGLSAQRDPNVCLRLVSSPTTNINPNNDSACFIIGSGSCNQN